MLVPVLVPMPITKLSFVGKYQLKASLLTGFPLGRFGKIFKAGGKVGPAHPVGSFLRNPVKS